MCCDRASLPPGRNHSPARAPHRPGHRRSRGRRRVELPLQPGGVSGVQEALRSGTRHLRSEKAEGLPRAFRSDPGLRRFLRELRASARRRNHRGRSARAGRLHDTGGVRVTLPFQPPLSPMLAKLQESIPDGEGWLYEPKWDGFRAIVYRDDDSVRIISRDNKSLDRYFPELVPALMESLPPDTVVD